tara:strand:+ start:5348 stop:5971 length:624 start_codon:yes stop_codon:yes gene_type:complete
MYYILMADIVDSSEYSSGPLMDEFKQLVKKVNKEFDDGIKSPLTITLGDEFQGIMKDLSSAVDIIFRLEELIVERASGFKMRYVLLYGEVETPIEERHAHGMLGKGLTEARNRLTELKKSFNRFEMAGLPIADQLNKLFVLFQHFVDSWHEKDRQVVDAFLKYGDYKMVAKKLKKDPSTMWRRERSLAISEYLVCKELIKETVNAGH